MTSQPGPGTTLRGEPTPPANRFTTSLLLQSSGGAKAILSNLKDFLAVRAPKFAHSSPATHTISLKDENFSRSQVASFALHGSLALLLFMTFVTRLPIPGKPIPHEGPIFTPSPGLFRHLLASPPVPGDHGGGSGGERNPIAMSGGDRPAVAREQIVAPSLHTFPDAQLQLTPLLEGPIPLPAISNGLPNWGDINSTTLTNSNGPGCCQGMGNKHGTGIGIDGDGPGGGRGRDGGVGTSAIGPPGNGVRSPSCQYCPRPEYSDEARRVHYQGLVMLNVVVLADGRPGRIDLVSGPGLGLDEKAIEAVRNWRFNPAIGPTGKAVAVVIPVEVQFQLF